MRILFLHIGHMKTGTTYLQSAFAQSRDALQKAGVIYPHGGRDESEIDLTTMTPVGNARHLLRSKREMARELKKASAGPGQHVLFSSELLFNQIWNRNDLSYIPQTAQAHGFDHIKILLFVRDPIPLAASIWQQRVKGWFGETRSLDDYITQEFNFPERALKLLERLDQTVGITLELHNHGAIPAGRGLLSICEKWLGIESGLLIAPPKEHSNRSMTRSEAELQRLLNLHNGPSGALFAYPVTTELSNIARDAPKPDRTCVNAYFAAHHEVLTALAGRLPKQEKFAPYDPPQTADDPARSEALIFTPSQLEILSRAIATHGPVRSKSAGRPIRLNPHRFFQGVKRGLKRLLGR